MTPETIVQALAELDPYAPSEIDGDPYCFFCGAYKPGEEPHSADCLWAHAKACATDLAAGD